MEGEREVGEGGKEKRNQQKKTSPEILSLNVKQGKEHGHKNLLCTLGSGEEILTPLPEPKAQLQNPFLLSVDIARNVSSPWTVWGICPLRCEVTVVWVVFALLNLCWASSPSLRYQENRQLIQPWCVKAQSFGWSPCDWILVTLWEHNKLERPNRFREVQGFAMWCHVLPLDSTRKVSFTGYESSNFWKWEFKMLLSFLMLLSLTDFFAPVIKHKQRIIQN